MPKKRKHILSIFLLSTLFFGFDFSISSIPLDEIHSGGPPKDGIPALTDPEFIPASEATFLKNEDRVLGINIQGVTKAYPISILNWHEVVNDVIRSQAFAVTYCPLCGTGMAFDSDMDELRYVFGVSGKLYNSDVLLYDKQTESLWSQIKMEAVVGKMTGRKLKWLPLEHTTWGAWKSKHPKTVVLSTNTGYDRDYHIDPYRGYDQTSRLMFPVAHEDDRLPPKEWVVGILIEGQAKAYAFRDLPKQAGTVEDFFNGKTIQIEFDPETRSAVMRNLRDEVIPSVQAFWFAWAAFYPETELWRTPEALERP